MSTPATRQLCRHLADLLSYPGAATRPTAAVCQELLQAECPAACEPFAGFMGFLDELPAARVEEVYTATFDLQPACHPYIAYQLCGESQKRALFLMQLQQLYRQHGFTAVGELPDHLATLLRFVAHVDDPQCREELTHDGMLPALDKMLVQAEHTASPYIPLLQVVRLVLAQGAAVTVPLSELRCKEVCS